MYRTPLTSFFRLVIITGSIRRNHEDFRKIPDSDNSKKCAIQLKSINRRYHFSIPGIIPQRILVISPPKRSASLLARKARTASVISTFQLSYPRHDYLLWSYKHISINFCPLFQIPIPSVRQDMDYQLQACFIPRSPDSNSNPDRQHPRIKAMGQRNFCPYRLFLHFFLYKDVPVPRYCLS